MSSLLLKVLQTPGLKRKHKQELVIVLLWQHISPLVCKTTWVMKPFHVLSPALPEYCQAGRSFGVKRKNFRWGSRKPPLWFKAVLEPLNTRVPFPRILHPALLPCTLYLWGCSYSWGLMMGAHCLLMFPHPIQPDNLPLTAWLEVPKKSRLFRPSNWRL